MSSRCPRSGSGGIGGGDEPDRSGEPEGAVDEVAAELAADFFTLHAPHSGTDAPNALRGLVDRALVLGLFPPTLYLLDRLAEW